MNGIEPKPARVGVRGDFLRQIAIEIPIIADAVVAVLPDMAKVAIHEPLHLTPLLITETWPRIYTYVRTVYKLSRLK